MRLSHPLFAAVRTPPWPRVEALLALSALYVDFLVAITPRSLTGESMNFGNGVVTDICGAQSASTFTTLFFLTFP